MAARATAKTTAAKDTAKSASKDTTTTAANAENENITVKDGTGNVSAASAEPANDSNPFLSLWGLVEKTDPTYTKPFNRGGGFRGTAVNATYLAKRATEVFGPMGIGWGMEILDESLMEGAPLDERGTRELIHKVRVKLWYKYPAEQSQGQVHVAGDRPRGEVVQFGQTTFVGRNKFGLFTDEEAPKKSLTDGMSKCLSLLGFSADVYLGRFDDNKYVAQVTAEFAEKRELEARRLLPKVTEDQADELANLLGETGTNVEKFCEFFKIDKLTELPAGAFERATAMLKKKLTIAA